MAALPYGWRPRAPTAPDSVSARYRKRTSRGRGAAAARGRAAAGRAGAIAQQLLRLDRRPLLRLAVDRPPPRADTGRARVPRAWATAPHGGGPSPRAGRGRIIPPPVGGGGPPPGGRGGPGGAGGGGGGGGTGR